MTILKVVKKTVVSIFLVMFEKSISINAVQSDKRLITNLLFAMLIKK